MVSFLTEMQAHDWERYAGTAAKPLPFLVFGTSILGFMLHKYIGIQIYVFFISFFIALLEAPWVFFFFPPCRRARDNLVDDFGFGKGWVRGMTYTLLSILCYVPKPSIALLAGLLIDIAALFYIFSSVFADHGVGEVKGLPTVGTGAGGGGAAATTGSYQPPTAPAGQGPGFGTF